MNSANIMADTAKMMEETIASTKQAMDDFAKAAQAAATQNYEQALADGKAQFEKISADCYTAYDEMTALGRGCIDAVMSASTIMAKGAEDLGKVWFAFVQNSADQSVATAKAVAAAKTVQEVVDLQSMFAKNSIEGFLAESSKISDLSLKVANEAFAPLNAKVNEAVEILSRPLAA